MIRARPTLSLKPISQASNSSERSKVFMDCSVSAWILACNRALGAGSSIRSHQRSKSPWRQRRLLLVPTARPRRVSPRQATYFLVRVQESRQRSAPRLPGLTASGCPRCERPAGPVAKLASLGQRDRTSPGEPSSLGGAEGIKPSRVIGCREIKSEANPHTARWLFVVSSRVSNKCIQSHLRAQLPSFRASHLRTGSFGPALYTSCEQERKPISTAHSGSYCPPYLRLI